MPDANNTVIRTTRQQRGLKLGELAERARVKYQHLANIESGHSTASIEVLHRIAGVLDIDVSRLIDGKRPEPSRPRDNRPPKDQPKPPGTPKPDRSPKTRAEVPAT